MGRFNATLDGAIVAEPELKTFESGSKVLTFPVYVNEEKKNKQTGEYEKTGNVSKIKVNLWNEKAELDIRKGDIVEVTGSLVEREYDKKDGTKGRSLESSFVDTIVVKWRKDTPAGDGGFTPQGGAGGF